MSKHKKRPEIPRFQHPIVETHCHLDYLDEEQLAEALQRSGEVGVEPIITIAVSPDNLDTVAGLAERHASVWGTQGIHAYKTFKAHLSSGCQWTTRRIVELRARY